MKNVDAMSDEEIDRVLQRHHDLLDALVWTDPREFATLKDYRRYLAGKIRMLEGERERRREIESNIRKGGVEDDEL